jgi:hypothetical protein
MPPFMCDVSDDARRRLAMIAAAASRKVWIFPNAAAAQELNCISSYSKVMPMRIAKPKFMILQGFQRLTVGRRSSAWGRRARFDSMMP